MDPRLALLQQIQQQTSSGADEKPGFEPPRGNLTPTMIQVPMAHPINTHILMSNVQSQQQTNLLQQYLYSNYLQQLALQQQRQASPPTFPLSFSPIQAATIPQTVLTADMNRKRKLLEGRSESPKHPHLAYYSQMMPISSPLLKSGTTTPTTISSTEKGAERMTPTPTSKFDPIIKSSPSNGFTPEQLQLFHQLFQNAMTTTTTSVPSPIGLTTSSSHNQQQLFASLTNPPNTVITSTPLVEPQVITHDSTPRETNPSSNEVSARLIGHAAPSTENSPALISLLTAPVARHSSEENQEEEEVDVDEDLDVVDVVGGIPGDKSTTAVRSLQRRAHINFYRKLKSFRNRERHLKCNLCEKMIENSDNGIRTHLYLHSHAPLFVCKICQVGFKERQFIFEHLNEKHPGKNADCFEDRRDMAHLGEVLFNCFPKSNAKTRVNYQDLLKKIMQYAIREKLDSVECQLCRTKISTQRHSLIQHLHVHQSFRCKTCKFTCQDEDEQIQHCITEHKVAEPKQGGYAKCGAQDVLANTFEKCFAAYIEQDP